MRLISLKKIEYDLNQSKTNFIKKSSSIRSSLHSDRSKAMEQSVQRLLLIDYVHIYFKQRFIDDEFRQLEWAYNLVASCRRFRSSSYIQQFWRILIGEVRVVVERFSRS
jgi:hypothetical protein